ncbi:lysophosphatidic acid receptor 2b [Hippoglossus hippoglossus]|uniref:lysophosphatidic acid receptor 2b n=1 Tax=Hippoglossus hippoglossus TaxID=8267 RepID=UPI00148B9B58|nr:lysophosphatidic acid receptor 2b [Hippoglossus hippoglossus]XP_034440308.1 lysophosphatidic acid receptor 2b [Hippoglossus hippoglossus]XP_034440318.1 lysophosphatidic acid receptor 2b [Hippoglossus hippoglossus]XP_035038288.1 lysophosphatidic acid receptor 2b [Hippoglossus stenolepis]XP_035038295.1 lysophosphatidic acid receptor 2b [Hippoglossus stenolepis]XP_035038303.1 lysophosphatidic acid receptor 2b [Hippoglossus stenolepis]XP_035038312.1 lysophosphatidic acid receptor 2b [Hippoglos
MDTLTDDEEGCYRDRNVTFFYEKSGKNISAHWRDRDYVIVSMGMAVCFIVIFSNLLVIGAILKNRRFHFPIYYLLGNLALSDLFSGISYLHLMFHTGPWTIKLSKYQWFVRQGLIDTSLTASVLNLLAVAVERHQTIFNMQLHSKMSKRRVFIIMVFIWLVAIIMGLVPTMGWHCLCDLPNCSTMAPLYSRSYLVFWGVLNLLTFSIMVAVYTRIFLYVRHKSKQMSQHTSQMRHRETVFNLMKTVSMILGCFVICWTPGLVVLLLDGLGCDKCEVLRFEKYFLVLAECNSFVNPIIYCFRDKDMRRTFKEILCFPCRRGRNPQDAAGTHFNTLDHETYRSRSEMPIQRGNGTRLIQKGSEDAPTSSDNWS